MPRKRAQAKRGGAGVQAELPVSSWRQVRVRCVQVCSPALCREHAAAPSQHRASARRAMSRCTRTSQRPNGAHRRSAKPAPSAWLSRCQWTIMWSRRARRRSPRGSKSRVRAQTLQARRRWSLPKMQRPPMPQRHATTPRQRQRHLLLKLQPRRARARARGHLSVMKRAWCCHRSSTAPLRRPALREPTAAETLWLWRSRPGGNRPARQQLHRPQFPRRQQATARCRKRWPSSRQSADVRAWRMRGASKTLLDRRGAATRTAQWRLPCPFSSPRRVSLM